MQVNHNCLLTVTWTVLLPAIRSIAGDMFLFHQDNAPVVSTLCSWHSRASAPWDTPVHQSWHVACQQSWLKRGWLLHLEYSAEACIAYHVGIRNTHELRQRLVVTWLNFSRAWWTMRLISGEKDWKHACPHRWWSLVTLNTCCDFICLTFKFSYNATGSFHSQQRLEGNDIPSVRWIRSAFHKVVW